MSECAAIVTVKPTTDGVELHASGEGRRVVLALDAAAGLTLADELTLACERQLRIAGVAG